VELRRDLEVGIGSQAAKTGAARVRAALESIKRKSKRVADAGVRDNKRQARGFKLLRTAALSLAGIFAAKSLIGSTIAFGQAVADLSAITGATGKDLDFLRQKSKEFGETTTLSATQAAEAFRVIASAKPDLLENVEALSLVTEEAIALAEATGEALPTAANTLGASLNQFSAAAEESSRFINVLAAGSKRGAALVGEMSEALKFAGVIAAQAGLSFEQTNAALQLMSTFAIKGGEAGTQLRGVLLALSAQSKDEWNPEIVGLQKALDNLSAANLSSGKATTLFGRRNLAAAKILIQNRERLSELTTQLTGTNVAYEQQAIRVDNLSGDIKALKSAYEGLELTIGAKLNGALRAVTQNATENIRALARNPLLQKATTAILDTMHRVLEDISLSFNAITTAVTAAGGGAEVFESVWGQAIGNIVKWTKFLWNQFVIAGPANLRLGFTLMIAGADRFRIALVETMQKGLLLVVLGFKEMAGTVAGVFDGLKTTIGRAIDDIIGAVQQKLFNIARSLANLGFTERAMEITNLGIALGGLATFEKRAADAAEKANQKRRDQIDVIDEMIKTIEATADAQREASRQSVAAAIAERDATVQAIMALRTKRKEIQDGANVDVPGPGGTGNPLADTADEAASAFENLGDVQKRVVTGMADGMSEMAARGKASFGELAQSIIQDLIRIALKAQFTGFFSTIFGAIGGLGSFLGPTGATALGGVGAAGASPVVNPFSLNAAHGAEFRVGGSGGTDSQFVSFKASPDETVSIKTPAQQRAGQGIVINQTNNIDASGADAERILAILPPLLEENKQRTLAEVIEFRNKGILQ